MNKIRKENRIRTALNKYENNSYLKMFLEEEKNIYSDMQKTKKMANYDEITKNRNFIFEWLNLNFKIKLFLFFNILFLFKFFVYINKKLILFFFEQVGIKNVRSGFW